MPEHPGVQSLLVDLGRNPFFRGLPEAALRRLAAGAAWREAAAGEVVFLEGESAPGLYYLQSGWLKIVKTSPEGREQVLRFAGPGEAINAVSAFTPRLNPATAISLEPSGLWLLRRETVQGMLREQPDLAQQVIDNMAERLVELVALVENLSLRPVTGRLARLLLAEATGEVVHRPRWRTQSELAGQLGTVPDVIQRALSSLAAQGAIEVERQLIRIKDRKALEKLAE